MTIETDHVPRADDTATLASLLAADGIGQRMIDAGSLSTAVLECGRGQPVVLLHGPGEFAATWIEVIAPLAATCRVIAPDLPGHGASDAPDELDASRTLSWLDDLIAATCDTPPVIVGRVVGGAIAARFAMERPDRLRQLVLVDTLGFTDFQPAPPFGEALHRFFGSPTMQTYDGLMQYCAYDYDDLRRRLGARWGPLAEYAVQRVGAAGTIAAAMTLMEVFGGEIARADLARISVPTTVIWGRHDLATPLRAAESATTAMGWPLYVIESAADDPALEQPEAFVAVLTETLEGAMA